MRVSGIKTAKPTSMKVWLAGLEAAACNVRCGGMIRGYSATIINTNASMKIPNAANSGRC